MNKEKNKIMPNQNVVYVFSVGGIRALINTNGIIDSNKVIPITTKKKIEKILKPGLENILDGWVVDGEFKNDTFYVKCIIDDNGKILDIYDTIDWVNIMGFTPSFHNKKIKFKDIEGRKGLRPECSFYGYDYESMTKNIHSKSWRKRVSEEMENANNK